MPLGFERRAAAQESDKRAGRKLDVFFACQGLGSLAQGTDPGVV